MAKVIVPEKTKQALKIVLKDDDSVAYLIEAFEHGEIIHFFSNLKLNYDLRNERIDSDFFDAKHIDKDEYINRKEKIRAAYKEVVNFFAEIQKESEPFR